MTLTEFLLARIAEDEQRYGTVFTRDGRIYPHAHIEGCDSLPEQRPYPCDCGLTTHLLAECAAKRAIMELHRDSSGCCVDRETTREAGEVFWHWDACPTLRTLALPYADHPDYDPSWAD